MYLRVEFILYFYLLVSIALIFYDIKYMVSNKKENEKHYFLVNKYINEYYENVNLINEDKEINKKYNENLVKELSKIKNLVAFNEAILTLNDEENFRVYIGFISNTFLELSNIYNKKSNMEKAFFVYVIGNFCIDFDENKIMYNRILSFLEDPSVYLVENILRTFIKLGYKEHFIKAIEILNLKKIYHNDKLISDGLLEYKGDKLDLAKELYKYRSKWMTCYVKSIIKFIKSENYDFREEFYQALTRENLDTEIRIEIVRYFSKVKYDKLLDYLLELIQSEKNIDINFLIVASTTLGNYPSDRTIEVLKKGMTNLNWYVRKNSCTSFLLLNPSEKDINDILNGSDRYARDILLYQLNEGEK